MKKISFVLLITLFAAFMLTACRITNTSPVVPRSDERMNPQSFDELVGSYEFTESDDEQTLDYKITIDKLDFFVATIEYAGKKIEARLDGVPNKFSLICEKDAVIDGRKFNVGDTLLRFEIKENVLLTYWEKMQPLNKENNGQQCFTRVKQVVPDVSQEEILTHEHDRQNQ